MQKIKAAIAGILSLFFVTEAMAQSAPATMPFHTVYGRLGAQVGDTGPGQAIPFTTLASQIFMLAPTIPVVHPSSTNVYGPGCTAASTTFWNVTENLCASGDTWILNSSDPSALFAATIGGSVTVGDTVGLTFSTTTGACASGCTASYTAVSGDTLTKVTQGLICAIANNSNLFNLNGSVCNAGAVNYGPGGVGGYAKGTVIGLLPVTTATTLNFDFNSASGLAVNVTVTGAATETVTITNTGCSTGCSKGWDVNPSLVFGRLVPGVAPPPSSQIFGLIVQAANSATPSAFATQYGVLANTVLSSTVGSVASTWSLLTPNNSGVMNQGIFVGAGLRTPGAPDNGVDSISSGTLTAVGTNLPTAGSGWGLLGGTTPSSYCTNWSTGAWLPCNLFGSSWDFKPSNSSTSGVSISTNLVQPDADAVTALGASSRRWSNGYFQNLTVGGSPVRTKLPVGTTNFYANSSATGCSGAPCSDSNDGLTTATAKKTVLGALYGVLNGYDFTCTVASASIAKINLLANEINAGASVHFGPHDFPGACAGGSVIIDGGAGFTLQYESASAGPLSVFFGPAFQLQNIVLANSLGVCVSMDEHASIRFGTNVVFGNCGIGLQASTGSVATFLNNFSITTSASMTAFVNSQENSAVSFTAGITGTITGSPTYTAFMFASKGGTISLNTPVWSGSITGLKYIVSDGASIAGGAAGLPGTGGSISSGGTVDSGAVPVSAGGTGATTPTAASANIFPAPTRAGDITYWNGTIWTSFAGNNSGTNCFSENSSGVPSWAACSGGGSPGGSAGQIQWNSAGSFAGFTVGGDATLNTATGALTLATVNSNTGAIGSATQCVTVTNNAKGLTTAVTAATCTPAIGSITGLGTGVATALGNAINTSGGVVTSPVANANLANPATTVAGQTCTLGSTCGLANSSIFLTADVNLTGSYVDGPVGSNGTTGAFLASGAVQIAGATGGDDIVCRLWDGTTKFSSAQWTAPNGVGFTIPLPSVVVTNPVANLKISCVNATGARGAMKASDAVNGNTASGITTVRIN